jgi:hypothetical protein
MTPGSVSGNGVNKGRRPIRVELVLLVNLRADGPGAGRRAEYCSLGYQKSGQALA